MPPSMDPVKEQTKPMRVEFYMSGGHIVVAENVLKVKMGRELSTGKFDSYQIEWVSGMQPSLFTLSITDIVAVVAK